MTYYIKGGSKYNEANPKVWTALFLGGFTDASYPDPDWKDIDYGSHITTKDPYWRFGSSSGGAQTAEFGLYNDYRIEIDQANGVRAWDGAGWVDLLAGGGGDLNDLDDVVITGTPADNEVLAWDNGSSKWINQTPTEAGLPAMAVSAVAAADDYVKNDGDTIYGNLEIRSASDGMFTLRSTVDGGNPGTPEAGWNYIQFKDKDGDRQGYFGIDSGGNFRFQPEVAGGVVLIMTELDMTSNKITSLANGTVSDDAMAFGQKYTLEQHNNTYHSTNYEVANANIQSHVGSPVTDAHHTKYSNANAVSAVQGEATLTLGAQVSIDGSGWLEGGNTPSGTTNLMYNGYFWATRVYNAVYNDYADYWKARPGVDKKPGMCYSLNNKGLIITNKRADKACIGICSDTYGFATGQQYKAIPISIGGFLLAYVDKEYESGSQLVPNKEGILTLATKKEIIMRLSICKYMFKEKKIKTKGIKVNGRSWVKVL